MTNELYYNIISTGSQGNSVQIEDTLIDCGLTAKYFNNVFINYLIITHKHSDHINIASVRKLIKLNPKLIIMCNHDVGSVLESNNITNYTTVNIGDTINGFTFYKMYHDVPCLGISFTRKDKEIFYATDTKSMAGVAKGVKFDYIFLEANYCFDKVYAAISNAKHKDLHRINQNLDRHLSKQDCVKFYALHKKDKTSKLIRLHQSGQFY